MGYGTVSGWIDYLRYAIAVTVEHRHHHHEHMHAFAVVPVSRPWPGWISWPGPKIICTRFTSDVPCEQQ